MFPACALECKAEIIVSCDPDIRNLKQFHGVKIIDVKAFMEKARKTLSLN
jgi:predicted nucleic acid-binding protein